MTQNQTAWIEWNYSAGVVEGLVHDHPDLFGLLTNSDTGNAKFIDEA